MCFGIYFDYIAILPGQVSLPRETKFFTSPVVSPDKRCSLSTRIEKRVRVKP